MARVFQNLKVISLFILAFFLIVGKINGQDLNYAKKLTVSERYEDASEVYNSILKSQPTNGDAYFYYGENIIKSYLADPYSSSLGEVCSSARDMFTRGLTADSTNMINDIGLGMVILLESGDTVKADKWFAKAEVFPKNKKKYTERNILFLIKLGSAQIYAKAPRYKKAIAYLNRAKEVRPENPDINDALGDIYMSETDASSAISNYNRALFLEPSNPVYKVKIGNIYMGARNLQEAKNLFEDARDIDSTYAPVYKGLGTMYSMSGFYKLAQVNFKKFLDLSGNNTPAQISYANALFKSKIYDESLKVIENILKVDSSRINLYRLAAYSAFDKKPADYMLALKYIEKFFKNTPEDKLIIKDYLYYGNTLVKLHHDSLQTDKGLKILIKVYKMDTTNNELYSNVATTAYALKHFNIAIQVLSDNISQGKASPADYFSLGKIYYQLKQYGKADTTFTKLIKRDTSNVEAWLWLANSDFSLDPDSKLGMAKPKYEMVIEKAFADTIKYAKELFAAYDYLGSYYLNVKPVDLDKAAKLYQKIITLDPKNKTWIIKGYEGLAIVAAKKKNYSGARDIFKTLLTLDPGNKDFQKEEEIFDKQVKAIEAAANQ